MAALHESERRFAEAERIAGFGSWEWDVVADRVTWSDELFRIFGLRPGEKPVTLGLSLGFLHPEDVPRVQAAIEAGVEQRRPFAWEGRIIRTDGIERIVASQGHPFEDRSSGLLRVVGVCQDVTERRRAEAALRDFSVRLQDARESEATRIAREIHDDLGQRLTALKMDVAWLERKLRPRPGLLLKRISDMSGLVDEAILSVRRLATELRPRILDHLGLVAALEWLTRDLGSRAGFACAFDCDLESVDLGGEAQTHVFRLVQEALTNVARHSGAVRAVVRLAREEDGLVVEVTDDGRGMTGEASANPQALGLMGMHERARLLRGELAITPALPSGTRVTLRCPLP
jgi:two-component system, NarL family, sensor histidine kinase UhpB